MKFIKKIIFLFRSILYLPLRILVFGGDLYSKIIKAIDSRNHDTFWQESMQKSIDKNASKNIKISTNKEIKFYCPSKIASYRVKTLFSKEPDTIKWLDEFGSEDKILYDIGANIGIYTIYYAKKFGSKVYAFEPSFRNLDLLARNVKLNFLQNEIFLIPNPVSKKFIFSDFFQLEPSAGQAAATFNDKVVQNSFINASGKDEKSNTMEYKTLGFSIDNLIENNLIEYPNLIKIDVDGNEFDIISGLKKTVKEAKDISILIETRKSTHNTVEDELKRLNLKKLRQVGSNSIWKK